MKTAKVAITRLGAPMSSFDEMVAQPLAKLSWTCELNDPQQAKLIMEKHRLPPFGEHLLPSDTAKLGVQMLLPGTSEVWMAIKGQDKRDKWIPEFLSPILAPSVPRESQSNWRPLKESVRIRLDDVGLFLAVDGLGAARVEKLRSLYGHRRRSHCCPLRGIVDLKTVLPLNLRRGIISC